MAFNKTILKIGHFGSADWQGLLQFCSMHGAWIHSQLIDKISYNSTPWGLNLHKYKGSTIRRAIFLYSLDIYLSIYRSIYHSIRLSILYTLLPGVSTCICLRLQQSTFKRSYVFYNTYFSCLLDLYVHNKQGWFRCDY